LDSELNTYITGQHIDPKDSSSKGNLTLAEIIGDVEIKPEARRRAFSYVISDTTVVPIIHNKVYDCTLDEKGNPVNFKDYTDANFIINQIPLVAISRKAKNTRHKFYMEDKEEEAKEFVIDADSAFEAEKLVREKAAISEYKDLVSILNLTVADFNVSTENMTDTRLKEVLIKQARKEPKTIVNAFSDRGQDALFLANLVKHDILNYKRGNGYYDGEKFVAKSVNAFIDYISDKANDSDVSKWGTLLKNEE
jgi:hypothetical protein